MNRADRLALAAVEAPILRSASEKTLARRVGLVDKDGNVVGYTSGREALKALAKAHDLEHVVDDGVRPREVVCQNCGKTVKVGKAGKVPSVCLKGCVRTCATRGCTNDIGIHAAREGARERRSVRCKSCIGRASMTREQRQASGRRNVRVMHAGLTTERKRAAGRACQAKFTPEQRSEVARARSASRTPEELSATARKIHGAMTPEQRSEARRKAWATRRAATEKSPVETE